MYMSVLRVPNEDTGVNKTKTITFRGSSSLDGRGSGWPRPKDARIRMALVETVRQGLSRGQRRGVTAKGEGEQHHQQK